MILARSLAFAAALGLAGCGADKTSDPSDVDSAPRDGGLRRDLGPSSEDMGTMPAEDMGIPAEDMGIPAEDMGIPPMDMGIPPMDMGTPPEDMGMTPEDMGAPPMDMGMTPEDMGAPPTDTGPADLGPPDLGPPDLGPPDMGPPICPDPPLPALAAEDVVSSGAAFDLPVFVAQAPGSPSTLWVVEKGGLIRLVRGGAILSTPFLDIRSRIGGVSGFGDERGLLGLAFHPGYAANGRFFVGYTPAGGGTNVVAEYRRSAADPDRADATEVVRLVATADPEGNHNGGMVVFGPDGFLYAGIGDGGGANDAHGTIGNGLDRTTLLGKLLRLDVDAAGAGYAAAGNPFSLPVGLPQIWAYGLRNPWRFSFDRTTGDLYIGDVGQNRWEEIDVAPGAEGGLNYGWRAYEGNTVFDADTVALVPVHTEPAVVNRHGSDTETLRQSCSITGGYVYRGAAIPALDGFYLYGDYCSADVAAFRWCAGRATGVQRVPGLRAVGDGLASFGQDNAGELYIVYQNDGRVVRIVGG